MSTKGFIGPNYTQIPNHLLGSQKRPGLMADMTMAELKVVLALCRLTFGFHRNKTRLSFRKLRDMTGLSLASVSNGVQHALERGLIQKHNDSGVTLWVVERTAIEAKESVPTISTVCQPLVQSVSTVGTPSKKETLKKKEIQSSSKSKTTAAVKSAKALNKHPAIQVYRDAAHLYPVGNWKQKVIDGVGDTEKSLQFWRTVCESYVGLGWNPKNVKGMLDFHRRHAVPQVNRSYQGRDPDDTSGVHTPIRWHASEMEG